MAKKIYCLAEMAYQHCGELDLLGGGELWLENFIDLLKKLGYDVKLYQFSKNPFAKKWRGHWIVGLGNMTNPLDINTCFKNGFNKFHEEAKNGDGIFYLSMNLSCGLIKDKPVLTVSHGLMIDRCEKDLNLNSINNLEALKRWIRSSTHTISVDTNTVKVNAVYSPENVSKISYIPNYADLSLFKPKEKIDNGKFTVLYPRRLDVARGYRTALEASEILLEKYGNSIEFIFCGKGNTREEEEFKIFNNKIGNKIIKTSVTHDKMPQIYEKADLSIIPTWYSEGSSLSCIESMASGVPCVVTCVGGLTDLVIPNFNGLMIQPKNTMQLVEAIENMYHNREELKRIRNNAINVSQSFSKDLWEKRIIDVIYKTFGK